jgi:hypothetical protein
MEHDVWIQEAVEVRTNRWFSSIFYIGLNKNMWALNLHQNA